MLMFGKQKSKAGIYIFANKEVNRIYAL